MTIPGDNSGDMIQIFTRPLWPAALAFGSLDHGRRPRKTQASGRDLDRCVEIDLSGCLARDDSPLSWSRNPKPVGSHAPQMKLNGHLDASKRCVDRLACRDAAGKIRNRCPPVATRVFVDPYEIAQSPHSFPRFHPACRLTEAKVPFGISSPRFPLTVTRPGLIWGLNWRWLPRVTTSIQPSCSRSRITSRTFTHPLYQIPCNSVQIKGLIRASVPLTGSA
jgi:hypothetical protein